MEQLVKCPYCRSVMIKEISWVVKHYYHCPRCLKNYLSDGVTQIISFDEARSV